MPDFPALGSTDQCPKCGYKPACGGESTPGVGGGAGFRYRYDGINTTTMEGPAQAEEEYIKRECPRCGYQWMEACADAEGGD